MKPLYERYRPTTLDDIIGSGRTIGNIKRLLANGIEGHAFWIKAWSGGGKTTLARLMAASVADPINVFEIDAQDVTLDQLRDWERLCVGRPLSGRCFAFVVNEAHGLRSPVVSRLLTVLESPHIQRNSVWLFTTTTSGEKKLFDGIDAKPFLSRAIVIEFVADQDVIYKLATRAKLVASQEGLDGQPIETYVKLVRTCNCNMRDVYSRIEAGEMLPP